MRVLISACLLGCACRYDGCSKERPGLLGKLKGCELVPVCPEQLGGLPTPRPASERRGEQVVNSRGEDVTAQYRKGAEEALHLCRTLNCTCALLKERSPSCGSGEIYDGTFTRTLIPGDGTTAELLKKNGIPVYGETQIEELLSRHKA